MSNISLKDFLKTYTAVSNDFIDEYYSFYESCENDKFGINAELVIKYLGYKQVSNFYEQLRKNYVIQHDYVIKRKTQRSQKGIKDAEYYLSIECFEKICMTSQLPKGNAVRDYFIILRKFTNYYMEHFANSINKMAKKHMYVILVDKNKNIQKFSRNKNMRKKLYAHATGKEKHPDIKFVIIIDDPKKVEKCTKTFVNKYKSKNKQELYKINHDILKSVVFNCADLKKSFDDRIMNKDKYDAYVVYDEHVESDYLDLDGNVVGYEKISKKSSKKPSGKPSKKSSKKLSKKPSIKLSKKPSKKLKFSTHK